MENFNHKKGITLREINQLLNKTIYPNKNQDQNLNMFLEFIQQNKNKSKSSKFSDFTFTKFEKRHRTKLFFSKRKRFIQTKKTRNQNNFKLPQKFTNIVDHCYLFLNENFESLNQKHSELNKKLDFITNILTGNSLKESFKTENHTRFEITSQRNHEDYFSFRLKDLSLNYALNTISNKTINDEKLLQHIKESIDTPNFLISEKNNKESYFNNINNEEKNKNSLHEKRYSIQNLENCNKNIDFNVVPNYESDNLSDRKNEVLISPPNRKTSIDDEINILIGNSDIYSMKELQNENRPQFENIENSNNEITSSNISLAENNVNVHQSLGSFVDSNLEKYKKIRGFNFKNNINTKKFNKQALSNKKQESEIIHDSVKSLGINNWKVNNNQQNKNFINVKSTTEDKVILLTPRNDDRIEKATDENASQQTGKNNPLNKKFKSSSNSSVNSANSSQNIDIHSNLYK